VRAFKAIRRDKCPVKGDLMRKAAVTFVLVTSLALAAPAKKHDSADKTYDKQGQAFAVTPHYQYSPLVDSVGRHYQWACDTVAGSLSCTDNPLPYLTYVRLTPDGPLYFAVRFVDKHHEAFAPALLDSLVREKDTHFNYRDYLTTAEGLPVICLPYSSADKKGKPISSEACYTVDTKNPRPLQP
jgi:hypothetical protein